MLQGSAVDCDAGRRQRGTAKTRGTDGALIGNAAADSKPGNTSFGGKTANPPVKVIAEEAEAEYDMEELD